MTGRESEMGVFGLAAAGADASGPEDGAVAGAVSEEVLLRSVVGVESADRRQDAVELSKRTKAARTGSGSF